MIARLKEMESIETPWESNPEAVRAMQERIAYFVTRLDEVDRRLEELENEWDVERMVATQAGVMTLIGLALGGKVNRRWYLLALGAVWTLLQQALQGRCLPGMLFQRFGCRSRKEIDEERFALKALRGDFSELAHDRPVDDLTRATVALRSARE